MAPLKSARHERFAQELAKGGTADAAYVAAGYKSNRGNAAALKAKESISTRVAELQSEIAARTVEATAVTRTDVLKELAKIGMAPVEIADIKAGDKRNALLNIAQIEGWVVSKHEHTGNVRVDLSVLSDEELDQLERLHGAVAGRAQAAGLHGGEEAEGG